MSIAPAADIVHLWADAGIPSRLVWRGRRYRVITAEPVRQVAPHDSLTHPAEQLVGWVLVAAAEKAPSDVRALQLRRAAGAAGWILVDVDPA